MEGIYLIHVREFAKSKDPIYKIGRSCNLENRIRNYPNGSIVLFTMKCKDSIKCETYLIKLFKEKFIQKTYYGSEYFKGDEDEMINEISKYLYIYNTTNKIAKLEFNNINNNVNDNMNKVNEKDDIKNIVKNENNDADNNLENPIKIAMDITMNKNINESVDKEIDKAIDKAIEKAIDKSDKIKNNIKKNTKENLKKNNNIINKDKSKICPNCNYEFKFPSLLKMHFRKSYHCLLSEDKIDNFFYKCSLSVNQCNKCNNKFKNRQAFLRHNRETKCGKSKNISNNNDTIINNLTNTITPELVKDIFTIIIKNKKIK